MMDWGTFVKDFFGMIVDILQRFFMLDLGFVHVYTLVLIGIIAIFVGILLSGGSDDE